MGIETSTLWVNGELVPYAEAKIHLLTGALHYGAAVFEGIRAYRTDRGSAVFRLPEHADRLLESAEILRVALAFDDFKVKGLSDAAAIEKLQRDNHLNQRAVRALTTLPKDAVTMEVRAVRIWELATGMILQEEIRTHLDMLLVARGQEITYPLIVRLNNFHQRKAIPDRVMVLCPGGASAKAGC